MHLSVNHTTRYEFSEPVVRGLQRLRLRPKSTQGQQVLEWKMLLEGACEEVDYEDQHHNSTALVSVEPGVSTVTVTCSGKVNTADNSGIIGRHSGHMPLWAFLSQTPLTKPGPRMRALASSIDSKEDGKLDALHELSRQVLAEVRYEIGRTEVDTPAEEAMEAGHGVCQDHTHIFLGAARLLGIPARYVSGYLMMDDRIDQEAGHGWAEAFVDGLGWVGFDVSNGICPDARYVRVATGCDYREAAPVTGISYGPGESVLAVSLAVEQHLSEQ
ncbi:MAG: transglutaminase family protein [Novosphingobium sp.]